LCSLSFTAPACCFQARDISFVARAGVAAEAAGVRTPRFWFELLRSPHRNRYRRAIAELPRWNLRAE
jgi:hypothetical protein